MLYLNIILILLIIILCYKYIKTQEIYYNKYKEKYIKFKQKRRINCLILIRGIFSTRLGTEIVIYNLKKEKSKIYEIDKNLTNLILNELYMIDYHNQTNNYYLNDFNLNKIINLCNNFFFIHKDRLTQKNKDFIESLKEILST
jgi:hypothetical protein